jgi:hypothetical protein
MLRRSPTIGLAALLACLTLPLPAAAQLPSDSSGVVVVDAGEEPRQELRYDWKVEQSERLRSVLTVDVAASEGGQGVMQMQLPVSMTIDATVTKVEPDGSAWVALTFQEMQFGPMSASGPGVPDGDLAAAEFDAAMASVAPLLTEARVWQRIDDRGQVLTTNVEFPEGFPLEARQQIAQTTNSVALLPKEPVGIGARWEATGTSESQGVAISVTSAMDLVDRDGDDVTVAMSMRDTGGLDTPMAVDNPFDEFAIEGTGTYRLDLAGVYPREASVTMTMGMSGEFPGEAGLVVPVEMQVDVGMTMSSEETN